VEVVVVAQIESVFLPMSPEHVERAWEESGDGRALVSAEEARAEREKDFVSVIPAQGGSVLVSYWGGRGVAGTLRARFLDAVRRGRGLPGLLRH
jgi:hypothetical protein